MRFDCAQAALHNSALLSTLSKERVLFKSMDQLETLPPISRVRAGEILGDLN